jgi:polar amino acid transport system substrate-binding protein
MPQDRPRSQSNAYPQLVGLVLACALILGIVIAVTVGGGADEPLEHILLATGEWAPFSGEKLDSHGVASAVVSAVLREMGYEPEFRFMPWARAEQTALANDTNRGVRATFPYAFTPERAAAFYYSKPIFSIELSIFYNARRNPSAASIAKADDLSKFVIVPISGYRYPPEVEKFVGGGPVVESNLAAFKQLLDSDRSLVVLEATRVGEDILAGWLGTDADAIATAPLHFNTPIHLIASKRNPNNSPFIRQFDEALAHVQRSGTLRQVESQVLESIDAQRTVTLQPLDATSLVEGYVAPSGGNAVLLPRGTRAVVERWSSNYMQPRLAHPNEPERMRVRILNGPQRGQRLYVDERTIVLP